MNPLLIRRRGMMVAQGGGLPYDSRVEYLYTGNTAGPVVITDVACPSNTTEIIVVFTLKDTSTSGTSRLYVSLGEEGEAASFQVYGNGGRLYNNTLFCNKTTSTYYKITATWNTVSNITGLNTVPALSISGISTGTGRTYAGQKVVINGYYNKTYLCFGCYFKDEIEILFDGNLAARFIPVRIGSVGYWYDEVNGKLWRSQSNIDYIPGPDIQ